MQKVLEDYQRTVVAKATLSTYGGRGSLEVYSPKSVREFAELYSIFCGLGIQPYILGGGSNVLIADGSLSAPIIRTDRLDDIRFEGEYAIVGCGARIARVISLARQMDLGGLEFLAGVPASLGGAIRMNAGAFGRQIGDLCCEICELRCQNGEATLQNVPVNGNSFSYRSGFKGIVAEGRLKLSRMPADESIKVADGYLAKRRARQSWRSLGSVFKNGDIPAGKLIEECGLKGRRIGGAEISRTHANIIVNVGDGSAEDFLGLVRLMEQEVYKKFGITLEREFVYFT